MRKRERTTPIKDLEKGKYLMCTAIKDGGLRCYKHAVEHLSNAQKRAKANPTEENLQRVEDATDTLLLTQKAIDKLRMEAEKSNNAELLADAERRQRLRDSKLRFVAELRARRRKETGTPGTMKEKLSLASNPETPTAMQEVLAKDKSEKVRLEVARNAQDSEVLDLLWMDNDPKVLAAVAKNSHTEEPALEALFSRSAQFPGTSIDHSLASNENCPASLYLPLVMRGGTQIRTVVAGKADVDAQTLELIAEDKFPKARKAAAESPNGSRKVYVTLGCREPETYVRSSVAGNEAVPADILQWIQKNDADWHVRELAGETLAKVAARETSENSVSV
jgi:hypothetical protein